MLILLPPSESKTAPSHPSAEPLDFSALSLAELEPARRQVTEALIKVSTSDDAQKVLKVGAKVMSEVEANRELLRAPTAPAHEIYTGVLYDALDAASLNADGLRRASEQVLIFSGLFGATGFTDPIPAYRLSMDVSLAPFGDDRDPGRLGTFWRKHLTPALEEKAGGQLIVDCRSSSYANAFRPSPERTLMVNNFTEKDGARKVVTHFAKHARGQLTGMLLRSGRPAETIDDIADIAGTAWEVEIRPAEGRAPHQLDLIEKA